MFVCVSLCPRACPGSSGQSVGSSRTSVAAMPPGKPLQPRLQIKVYQLFLCWISDPNTHRALPDGLRRIQDATPNPATPDSVTRDPVTPHPASPDPKTFDLSNGEPSTLDSKSPDPATQDAATPHHATSDPAHALSLGAPACARPARGRRRRTGPREVSDNVEAWTGGGGECSRVWYSGRCARGINCWEG